jgi:hypothetical protein
MAGGDLAIFSLWRQVVSGTYRALELVGGYIALIRRRDGSGTGTAEISFFV